ncbi:hypothetical protein LJR143_002173 [Pseudoxanthomonas sp. LjRoot143]|uniref:hypothetical protein n=1 Tax=Pseudoxanthomonas sp. LjRoot143 TaxID=3342266 RepID=UPI003ECE5B6F
MESVVLGAGAAWLTSDEGAALVDGKPGRAARVQRISGPLAITLNFQSPIVLGVVALLGLNLPEGVTITAAGAAGVTRRLADGSVGCWLLAAPAAPVASLVVVIDAAQTVVEIGEIVAMKSVTVRLSEGWSLQRVDTSVHARNRGGQVFTAAGASYRRFTGSLAGVATAEARGGGLANGEDWETIAAALTGGRRCVVIPQYRTLPGGVFDAALCNRTALYGIALEVPGPQNIQRQYFSGTMTVEEIPP